MREVLHRENLSLNLNVGQARRLLYVVAISGSWFGCAILKSWKLPLNLPSQSGPEDVRTPDAARQKERGRSRDNILTR